MSLLMFDVVDFCGTKAITDVLGLVGTVITIFRWAIPILLIIIGSFDLGKAVVGDKPDDIKKAYSGLIKRAIAAIIIFFIPAIVVLLVSAVGGKQSGIQGCMVALGWSDVELAK